MYVNPNHHGQVLIFPAYTSHTENSFSLVSVLNGSPHWSAARVRLITDLGAPEEVNIYLRPHQRVDFAIAFSEGDLQLNFNESSAEVCVLPEPSAGPWFSSITLVTSATEEQLSGFFEVIEMGALDPSGLPDIDCDTLRARWSEGGAWQEDPEADLLPPDGQLSGHAWLIDVLEGEAYPLQPIAVSGYSDSVQHGPPGSLAPNLASGTTNESLIPLPEGVRRLQFDSALDAMTGLFMATEHRVEVHAEEALNGSTELVVLFPTLRLYPDDTSPFDGLRGPLLIPFSLSGEPLFQFPCDQPQFLTPPDFDPCGSARVTPPLPDSTFYVLSYPSTSRRITSSAWGAAVNPLVDQAGTAAAILVWSANSEAFDGSSDERSASLSATTEDGLVVELHGQPAVVTVLNGVSNGQMTTDFGSTVLNNYGAAFPAVPTRLLLEATP